MKKEELKVEYRGFSIVYAELSNRWYIYGEQSEFLGKKESLLEAKKKIDFLLSHSFKRFAALKENRFTNTVSLVEVTSLADRNLNSLKENNSMVYVVDKKTKGVEKTNTSFLYKNSKENKQIFAEIEILKNNIFEIKAKIEELRNKLRGVNEILLAKVR